MMKMPILLSGHSMTPAGVLRPQSMSLNLRTDGLSSASMVLDEDNPDVTIGSWVQIWAPNGEMCVMYVKNRKKDYITGLITLSLEHTFGLLQAMVVFGEVTAATMSGTQSATTCTVTQAITYLLNQQTESLWTLYSCDFSDAQGWKFTNSDIYNDLNNLTDAIMDCQWEFDQSVFPWRLSLKAWPTSTTMEMRRNRNLNSLRVTQDRSDMYTRVYPTGKNNLHIDAANSGVSYLDRNTATYGVIAQVITDSTIASADLLKAWAQKQLKKNAEPKYTVSITGYDLSEATGEPMDHFIIGRMCRIPLPEYSTTITERLTELSWKDCINQADVVTCTLANELKTITGVLNEKARGGGGGGKKANTEHDCELEENEVKIDEFDNSDIWINRNSVWAVCAQYDVITRPGQESIIRLKDGALLEINRCGVYQTVGTIISDQDSNIGALDTWVDTFEGSALWTQRDNITGVCGEYDVVYDATTGKKTLKIKNGTGLVLRRDNTEYGVYDDGNLTGGVMVQKINGQTGTKLTLQADVIDINGLITALAAKTIGCAALNVTQGIDCGHLYSDTYVYAEGNITCNGTLICDSFNAGGTTHSASWKSQTVVTSVSISNSHSFLYGNASLEPTGRASGSVVLSTPGTTTIHYLGY